MKCPKCNTKNILKASYCMKCKYSFSEEDQEKAYKKTIFYTLEKIEEWYYHLTLETITSHIAFKIGSLLLVLGIGLYYYFTVGINTAILKNDSYDLYYYKKKQEYYLITNQKEEINLNLYIPNRAQKVIIKQYDEEGSLIDSTIYQKKKPFKIETNSTNYYVIETKYRRKTEKQKLKIYDKEEISQ